MADVDDAIAATAVGLNEDAKAARKSRGKGKAETPAEPSIVSDVAPEEVAEAVESLGRAVEESEGGEERYDLSETAHETAIERMEANASAFTIDARSLIPDVRDFLLQTIKDRPKPWAATSNAEQRDVAAACEHAGTELVRKIIEAVRSNGAVEPIRCLLVGFSDKADDIKVDLKVKAGDPDATLAAIIGLHKARGKHVLVTVASIDDFRGDGREAELLDDQPAMDFEAGSVEAPPADDSDLAGDEPEGNAEVACYRTGDKVEIEPHGEVEIEVVLGTGMVVGTPTSGGALDVVDIREATPDELAAERERQADFTD